MYFDPLMVTKNILKHRFGLKVQNIPLKQKLTRGPHLRDIFKLVPRAFSLAWGPQAGEKALGTRLGYFKKTRKDPSPPCASGNSLGYNVKKKKKRCSIATTGLSRIERVDLQ